IPEDELPYIFERYRKGNHPKREGTGLGLAIVKKILELHRSSISVESTLNHGTQFAFNLPLATA
ncbi:MAG: ATP-binding protein, partial [Bacteroidota bacterium]